MKHIIDWVAPKSLYRLGSIEIGTDEDGVMFWKGLEKDVIATNGCYEVHGRVTSIGNITILHTGIYGSQYQNYEQALDKWLKQLKKLPKYYKTAFYVREFDGDRAPVFGMCLDGSIDLKEQICP